MDMKHGSIAADVSNGWFSFSSADQTEEFLERHGVDQPMKQLGTGPFKAKLSFACADGMELLSERYATGLSLNCGPPRGSLGVLFTHRAEGEYRVDGSDVGDGELVFFPLMSSADFVASGMFGSDSVILPERRFNEIIDSVCPDFDFPEAAVVLPANKARIELLRAELALQLNQRARNSERFTDLVDAAVTCVGELRPVGPACPPSAASRRGIAKRAQAYIEAHYMDSIRNEDICRACEVGVRALQRAFRDYFGFTITEYIRTTRLGIGRITA